MTKEKRIFLKSCFDARTQGREVIFYLRNGVQVRPVSFTFDEEGNIYYEKRNASGMIEHDAISTTEIADT